MVRNLELRHAWSNYKKKKKRKDRGNLESDSFHFKSNPHFYFDRVEWHQKMTTALVKTAKNDAKLSRHVPLGCRFILRSFVFA